MLRMLILTIALLAVGCGGDDTATGDVATTPPVTDAVTPTDAATDPATESATDSATDSAADSATEPAMDEATDEPTDVAADGASGAAPDDLVCFGLRAVLDGYEDFLEADPDSDQQREAVELIGQFAREVTAAADLDSPELEEALDTLHANAAQAVSEGQDAAEQTEVQDALQTVEDAEADCAATN